MKCVFTIDVEDWFHILDHPAAPKLADWDSLPSRVERNFSRLLEMLAEHNVRATCFFLGWIAHRFPHLVRRARAEGHEIASHGYAHELIFRHNRQTVSADALRARHILEDIIGQPVFGFRAPGFSLTSAVPWFYETVAEAGYLYDSSSFPARRAHGGLPGSPYGIHIAGPRGRKLVELPVSMADVLGTPMCFFGGGYLRLFPLQLTLKMAQRVLSEGRPVIFWIHPREIDPDHPRLPLGWVRSFKAYVNLKTTKAKVEHLLTRFEFTTAWDLVNGYVEEAADLSRRAHALAAGAGSLQSG